MESATFAALISAGAALASAWFARAQFRGKLVVFPRPREDGHTTIDVIVKNVGGGSLRMVEVDGFAESFEPLYFEEIPAQAEYCIDTLNGRSERHVYYSRRGRLRARWKKWNVDPSHFSGVQTRSLTAVREIANTLKSVERDIRDSPVVQKMGSVFAMSRTGEDDPWPLPPGVLAVLVPLHAQTYRASIQDETELGDSWRQRRPTGSSAGTHSPVDTVRVVVDPERLTPEDGRQLETYLNAGMVTLHYRDFLDRPIAQFRIRTVSYQTHEARVYTREVEYIQPPREPE